MATIPKLVSMSVIFIRRKQGKNSRDDAGGRLMVGWRVQDWTPVYYEPIDGTGEATESPDMALFRFTNPHGEAGAREPMENEVAWLPQLDPTRFPSKSRKERLILQKRFLNDAWRYCAERDPDRVTELEEELDDPFHRQWTSWFEIAKHWKNSDVKRRKDTIAKRKKTAADAGINLKDADINDDDSDDDSAIGDLDMPPPPRPRPGGGNGGAAAAPANGRKRPGTTAKAAAKRNRSNGASSSSSTRNSSTGSQYMMSGALGSRGSSTRRSTASGSRNEDEEDDTMSVDFDDRHPTPAPRADVRNGFNYGGMPTPLTQRLRTSSHMPNDGIPPFADWAPPYGGSGNNIGARTDSPMFEPSGDGGDGERGNTDQQRLATFNGGRDEDQAYADALRASVQPENIPEDQQNGEGELPDDVQRSIEDGGQGGEH